MGWQMAGRRPFVRRIKCKTVVRLHRDCEQDGQSRERCTIFEAKEQFQDCNRFEKLPRRAAGQRA